MTLHLASLPEKGCWRREDVLGPLHPMTPRPRGAQAVSNFWDTRGWQGSGPESRGGPRPCAVRRPEQRPPKEAPIRLGP